MGPHDLASARHVWLFVRMSVMVSMFMNQSSSFEESGSSNVGISWSMVVVRLDPLCVAHRVSVYACMVLCTGASLDWGAGWSAMVRCCSLFVSCDNSPVGVDWGVLDFKFANWFLICWNCKCYVSLQYSSDESLSLPCVRWSCGIRSNWG